MINATTRAVSLRSVNPMMLTSTMRQLTTLRWTLGLNVKSETLRIAHIASIIATKFWCIVQHRAEPNRLSNT